MRSRSSEATRRWLNDIQHHIAMAQGFIAGMSYEAFTDDNLHLYAVTRCLEIISEASRRLPQELKARHKESMWGGPSSHRHSRRDHNTAREGRTI